MSPSTTLVLLHLLLLVSLASGDFYGGSVSFTPRDRNADGTYMVDFRYRNIDDSCNFASWDCCSGNCGYSVNNERGQIAHSTRERSDQHNQWCETETIQTRKIPSNRPFQMIQSNPGSWFLETKVDLGTRSDTGVANRSPVTATLPRIRVPQNCQRSYNLMAFDPDDDRVRCRYGLARPECDSCNQPLGFYLDQGSCSLQYGNGSMTDVYRFEVVVEDFPKQLITLSYNDGSSSSRAEITTTPSPTTTTEAPTTTTPPPACPIPWIDESPLQTSLSRLPLQFTVQVDLEAPTCDEGVYLPRFVNPTPRHGQRIQAEVNKELEIRVKAEATNSVVDAVIVSGPVSLTNHRTTEGEFVIRWSPTHQHLGQYFPFCFLIEGLSGSRVYQSELRCVLVEVGPRNVRAEVVCDENQMTVEVERSSIPEIDEKHLRLSDSCNTACDLQRYSNSTHIIGVIPLNACGTQIEEDDENLIFKNEITSFDNVSDIITRNNEVDIKFYCEYAKHGKVSLSFNAHRESVSVMEKGFGTFTYHFEFYQTSEFTQMVDPHDYPIDVEVDKMIYMEIRATSTAISAELFVESCRAAPFDTPNYSPTYHIIENGCTVDRTVRIFPPLNEKSFRFGMEAFKFIGVYDHVYISCSVILCEAGNPNTRCAQGCSSNDHESDDSHQRHKREAAIQTGKHHISQGPLRLRKNSESSVTNLNKNTVLMAGSIVAAVSMLCGVMFYKLKSSKVKYQPVPTSDFL
ncbi:hypothetical protein UPYG_G00089310 [Umbra pygmaea]|uniref:ZP domain-containing protein n=1 Tax=Umbra pygmaea TaxID=75934 RepID=A0ABD0XFF4_UMBPY